MNPVSGLSRSLGFPEGYVCELSKAEKRELVENFDRFKNLKHSSVSPKVFVRDGTVIAVGWRGGGISRRVGRPDAVV